MKYPTNFLSETEGLIESLGYETDEIVFIGSSKNPVQIGTWEDFRKVADFDYDQDATDVTIAQDLVIVFDDGCWLEREDASCEAWRHCEPPAVVDLARKVTVVADPRGLGAPLALLNPE